MTQDTSNNSVTWENFSKCLFLLIDGTLNLEKLMHLVESIMCEGLIEFCNFYFLTQTTRRVFGLVCFQFIPTDPEQSTKYCRFCYNLLCNLVRACHVPSPTFCCCDMILSFTNVMLGHYATNLRI